MKITLPWPDKRLSPNARTHWGSKAGITASARHDARWLTVDAPGFNETVDRLADDDGLIPLTITFFPPDRRHRDDDNMIGSFKAARDGIANALGVNDRRFRPHYHFGEPRKPGRVEVEIGGAAQ